MLKDLEPRLYQQTILATCVEKNTLVVLPTGMGKSIVFVLLIAQRIKQYPNTKAIILAPTKPLAEQHLATLQKFLDVENVALFTGATKPEERAKKFESARIIASTPQTIENDLVNKRISFKEVSTLIVDECHRAVKDYSYVWLSKHYLQEANHPRILGLTASPGADKESIKEVCSNLGIEAIEVRTEEDPDVKPYVQEIELEYVNVELGEDLEKIRNYFILLLKAKGKQIEELGFGKAKYDQLTKRELLGIQAQLQGEIARGEKSFESLKAMSVVAELLKAHHGLELLETQGIFALYTYLQKLKDDAKKNTSKAVKNLVEDINFRSASILLENAYEKGVEHPKFEKLKELIEKQKGKVIIFNQYRDNALRITDELNTLEGISAKLFVGQAKKNGTGLSQKEQKEMLDSFRNGEFNTIVMTSVGEEGLDIPKVDMVVFFEPVSSAIRHIQRRGRTGRLEKGKVVVLVTKNTRDEAHRWSSHHKQRKMVDTLKSIKKDLVFESKEQQTLSSYQKVSVKIYADHREKTGKIVKQLLDNGVELELKQLDVADYILSEDVGVELKTVPDFVNSLVDGRLLEQIKDLKYNFRKPLVIIEGQEDLYSVRNIHPNAIRGMLATITISFGIPILQTKHFRETTELFLSIAKREQEKDSNYSPHPTKRGSGVADHQAEFISALPHLGMQSAQELLKKFGSPKNIVNASIEELQEVDKIGKTKAKDLHAVFNQEIKRS